MDVSQYLEIFIDESNEHLQNLSDGIMILEKEPDNSDTINEIFRAAHSLKGMAGTMGYKRMQNLTHDMENVFSEVRNGNIKVDSRMVDVLFQCLDALEQYVNNIQETSDEGTDDNEPIIKALNSFIVNNEDKGALPEEAKKEDVPAEEKKEENVEAGADVSEIRELLQRPKYRHSEQKDTAEVHDQRHTRLSKSIEQRHYRRVDAERDCSDRLKPVNLFDHLGKLCIVPGKETCQLV